VAEIDQELTLSDIPGFIDRSLEDVPGVSRQFAIERMRDGLVVDPAKNDTAAIDEVWTQCAEASKLVSDANFAKQLSLFLRDVVCEAKESREAIATGIIRNWILDQPERRDFSTQLARELLGEDGKPCAAIKTLSENAKDRLRSFLPTPEMGNERSSPSTTTDRPN
jgi:hypothetical protein